LVSPCGHYRDPTWHRTVIASTFESVGTREMRVAREEISIAATTPQWTGDADFNLSGGSNITMWHPTDAHQ
jgi:hypothetical protein